MSAVVNTATTGMQKHQDIDYLKVLKIAWSRWYWILCCVLIALIVAFLYLWYTPPTYTTVATLKFEEKRSEISELLNVKNNSDRANKIQSESYVIRSREVMYNAIASLNYKISYYLKGRVRTTDIYPEIPFPIQIIQQDSTDIYQGLFELSPETAKTFSLSYKLDGKKIETKHHVNEIITINKLKFKIPADGPGLIPGSIYLFRFNSIDRLTNRVNAGLSMAELAKNTNILAINMTDVNPAFATDVLNALLKEYVSYDRKQRSISASQTINFIDTLQHSMHKTVKSSSKAIEQFKVNNKMINLNANTGLMVGDLTKLEADKRTLELAALLIDQLEKDVVNNKNENTLNYNLQGITDPLLGNLIQQLNTVIIERKKQLESFKASSGTIQQTDLHLTDIKAAIISNIHAQKLNNKKAISFIDQHLNKVKQNVSSLPKSEQDYIGLQADFEINQKVYTYLSEKKLEAAISKAAIVPDATIVNYAKVNDTPIAPIPGKVYNMALLLGLSAGVGLIILVRMANPYIFDKETVENLTTIPIIGVIRKYPGKIDDNSKQILSLEKPKSIFAESVRSVRTNLSFLASEKNSKIICISSEIAGEGKSFTVLNLASTLSLIDKKVLIIAADLRRSRLHHTFNNDNKKGLSSFLSNQNTIDEILFHSTLSNMDYIPSGPVPPNPSELLYSQKMNTLLQETTNKYDYVIIDSAPVGLVSDAIPLIRMSDINLFVIRSGVSKIHAASIPEKISKEYSLNNVAIVLNAFENDQLHSRYYSSNYFGTYNKSYYYSDYNGYASSGYYTDDEKSKWWKFWQKR